MRKLLLIALLASPSFVQASPWCLILDGIENCSYATADYCYSAVASRGGSCLPNPREIGIKGDGPYCLVTSTERRCTFSSLRSCRRTADSRGDFAGCVENTDKALELSGRRGEAFQDLINDDF